MNSTNFKLGANDGTDDAAPESTNSRVLEFDEDNSVSTGKDINEKITSLDLDLSQLRAELEIINGSVEEGLDRLSDKDIDLTAKVSETYKRLGEIDNAYKALLEISSRIDSDIQKLNGDVSHVAEQSASGIKNLAQSTLTQSKQFAEKNQRVISRVNHLVETSKLTNEMMNLNIQSATEKMLQIEKNVLAQIESLSSATKDKTGAIEKTVNHNRANILKLQSVDEAIMKRASGLEMTTAELTAKAQFLDTSVEQLQITSDVLSGNIKELKQRTQTLEELTHHHGSLIGGLQKASASIAGKLAVLSGREIRHFRFVTVSLLLLLVLSVVMYISQQSQFSTAKNRYLENSNRITDLQQVQTADTAETNSSLTILENKIEQAGFTLQSVQDQVQSVEGRLDQAMPSSRFGKDSIIHGPQQIAELPQNNLTVQLAYVNDKDSLFKIAKRYRNQMNDTLYYLTVGENNTAKYVLLSGSYPTRQEALSALDSLPGYINNQKPVIRKLAMVQKYITESQ